MTGKRNADDRQQNLFGASAVSLPSSATKTPKQRSEAKVLPDRARPKAPPVDDVEREHDRLPAQLAQLSAPELRALVETLPDQALGQLIISTMRQLKRRLAKDSRNGQKSRVPALDRALQQFMAELHEGYEDDF